MRLTEFEIKSIKNLAYLHFGPEVHVFLFGSRTNDILRGGDIDLFISSPEKKSLNSMKKIEYITDLIILIGEQKIDVILDNIKSENNPLFKTIRKSQIQLC